MAHLILAGFLGVLAAMAIAGRKWRSGAVESRTMGCVGSEGVRRIVGA